jgi:hypothetical protein
MKLFILNNNKKGIPDIFMLSRIPINRTENPLHRKKSPAIDFHVALRGEEHLEPLPVQFLP